jgi:dihydroxyacetone kinase-like predicted kinase
MKRLRIGLALFGAIATTALLMPTVAVLAQTPDPQEDKDKSKSQPFHGKVDSVDVSAKTLTVDGKLIYISSDTKLTSKDKAITLSEIKVGDTVQGATHKTFDGKTEALTVKVGSTSEKKDKD